MARWLACDIPSDQERWRRPSYIAPHLWRMINEVKFLTCIHQASNAQIEIPGEMIENTRARERRNESKQRGHAICHQTFWDFCSTGQCVSPWQIMFLDIYADLALHVRREKKRHDFSLFCDGSRVIQRSADNKQTRAIPGGSSIRVRKIQMIRGPCSFLKSPCCL